jgi:hypothetical protein
MVHKEAGEFVDKELELEGDFMYDVVMLAPQTRQEFVGRGSLRRNVAKYLERRFGARFHHELAVLHPDGLQILVRRAKVVLLYMYIRVCECVCVCVCVCV